MQTVHPGARIAARVAAGGAIAVIAIGMAVLAGWMFHFDRLMTVFPGSIRMKPNTALALIAAATALFLEWRHRSLWLRRALVCVPIAFGSLTLFEYISGLSVGIDQLLFLDPVQKVYPGRMAHVTAANLLLIGTALLLTTFRPRLLKTAQALTIACGLSSLFAIVGYLYGVPVLYGSINYTSMAFHTGVSFLVLALGLLFVHPDRGFAASFWSSTSGGLVARKLVPLAIVIPIALGAGFVRPQLNFGELRFGLALSVMTSVITIVALISSLARSLSVAERVSAIDDLTRIYNRRYFDRRLENELVRSERMQTPLSLILLDVDHFKSVNDGYGHVAGDAVLQWVAAVIEPVLRSTKTFCRYGGEEFAIIVPDATLRHATAVAERVREAIARSPWPPENLHLTISAGVAEAHPGDTPLALVNRADEALYTAKKNGRNRVESRSTNALRLVLAAAQ